MVLRTNRKAWAMLAFAGLLVALGIRLFPITGQNELHEVRHHGTLCFDYGPYEGGEAGDREAASQSPQLSGGADQPIWMLRACVIHHETRNSRIYSRTGFRAARGNKRVEPTVIQVTAIDSAVKEDETWTA
jgi:hypothetical protein